MKTMRKIAFILVLITFLCVNGKMCVSCLVTHLSYSLPMHLSLETRSISCCPHCAALQTRCGDSDQGESGEWKSNHCESHSGENGFRTKPLTHSFWDHLSQLTLKNLMANADVLAFWCMAGEFSPALTDAPDGIDKIRKGFSLQEPISYPPLTILNAQWLI